MKRQNSLWKEPSSDQEQLKGDEFNRRDSLKGAGSKIGAGGKCGGELQRDRERE